MDISALHSFLIATALWALVGIEREMAHAAPKKGMADSSGPYEGFGGIRSYALIGLSGAFCAWIGSKYSTNAFVVAGFAATALFATVSHAYASFRQGNSGITSEFAALAIYLVGVTATLGQYSLAVVTTVGIMALLSAKNALQGLRQKIRHDEFQNAMKFAVVAFLVLPILPDEKYSFAEAARAVGGSFEIPWKIWTMEFFNPHSVWLFVVIMSSVEFAGYVLSKLLGTKGGILASGAVGGLVSSTAVTAAMTAKSREDPKNSESYAVATLAASGIMLIRVTAIVSFVAAGLLASILLPAAIMFAVLAGSAAYLLLRGRKWKTGDLHVEERLESPFRIMPAIKFALFVVLIKFASAIGVSYRDAFDPQFLYYGIGILSGLADVDAISLDMAGKFSDGTIPSTVASAVILIAVMSNNFVKAGIAFRFGEPAFGKAVLSAFAASAVLGVTAIAYGF